MDVLGVTPVILALAFAISFAAGVVKGAVGFALPLIMVSGLSTVMDPKLAIATMLLPVVFSNLWQTFRQGLEEAMSAVREYWRYLLVVCLAILAVAQTLPFIPNQMFHLVLGVPVVGLSILQLVGYRPKIPPENRRRAEWGIGLLSGVFGGLAGTWGPTTVLYLIAIGTPKARQMVVQGVIYGTGSVALFAAHLQSGLFNKDTAPLSALLLIPAWIGMRVGFRLQDRMDAELFRKATLCVLIIAGLNLVRRGLFG